MRDTLKLGALLVLLAAYGCAAPAGITGSIDMRGTSTALAMTGAPLPNAKTMPDSQIAAPAPAGFVSFCTRFPEQCMASKDAPSVVKLSPAQWLELQEVNQAVNLAIKPMDDERHYGRAEYWNIPTDGLGDCEDYALTKRKELTAAGYPISALRIAIVVTRQGERHAVLTVATDKGDLVLDNLNDEVKGWNSTGYRWIERQDPVHAMQWVSVDENPVMLAAAAHSDEDSTAQIPH